MHRGVRLPGLVAARRASARGQPPFSMHHHNDARWRAESAEILEVAASERARARAALRVRCGVLTGRNGLQRLRLQAHSCAARCYCCVEASCSVAKKAILHAASCSLVHSLVGVCRYCSSSRSCFELRGKPWSAATAAAPAPAPLSSPSIKHVSRMLVALTVMLTTWFLPFDVRAMQAMSFAACAHPACGRASVRAHARAHQWSSLLCPRPRAQTNAHACTHTCTACTPPLSRARSLCLRGCRGKWWQRPTLQEACD